MITFPDWFEQKGYVVARHDPEQECFDCRNDLIEPDIDIGNGYHADIHIADLIRWYLRELRDVGSPPLWGCSCH